MLSIEDLFSKKYEKILAEKQKKFYSFIEGAFSKEEGDEREEALEELGWKFLRKEDVGVRVYKRKAEGSSFVMFMTTVFVPDTTPKEYFDFCHSVFDREDNDEIHRRNDLNKGFNIIRRYTEQTTLEFCRAFTGSAFVCDREFAYFRNWKVWDESETDLSMISVFLNSLDNEDDKLVKKVEKVRGKNYYADFFIKQNDGVNFVTIIHTDPCGWFPSFLYNTMASGTIVKSAINPRRIFLEEKKKSEN